jgi:hypothetical protein
MAARKDIDLMLKVITCRPRMFCGGAIETGRDLILFLEGAFWGAIYPGMGFASPGEENMPAYRDYVYRRFDREPPRHGHWCEGEFPRLLLEELGDKPIDEVLGTISDLYRGIRRDTDDQESTQS